MDIFKIILIYGTSPVGIILIKEAGGIINDIDLNNIENIKVITSSPNISEKFNEKISNF